MLIDHGRMLDGEDALKATGRTPVALVSPATMETLGLTPGQHVTITGTTGATSPTGTGSTGLPVALADLPDGVVWVPTTSSPSQWSPAAGSVVTLTPTQGAGA
jgi:NADH-quinone oxidoreductase subunit G